MNNRFNPGDIVCHFKRETLSPEEKDSMLNKYKDKIIEFFDGNERMAGEFINACGEFFDEARPLFVSVGKYLEVGYAGEETSVFAALENVTGRYYYKNRRDKQKVYFETAILDLSRIPSDEKSRDERYYSERKIIKNPRNEKYYSERNNSKNPRDEKTRDEKALYKKEQILKRYFGYDSFKEGQAEIVDSLVSGRDVMCIMPTGAGKSICYQVPALMREGLTIVISPLISLMKDQVQALEQMGIEAAYINSSLRQEEYFGVTRGVRQGRFKLLYVAPERLSSESFVELCREAGVSMVAIDEAHCISQWGQDFRPDYLEIVDFISKLEQRPVVGAFTATATKEVRTDIINILNLKNPFCITTGFDRPNLFFSVHSPSDKDDYIFRLLRRMEGESGIIYCATRKSVEELCETLQEAGFPATRYHAGLSPEERKANQEDFIYDRKKVIVATNAFGMGIDKSNVAFVVHYNLPKSIENYYQEAGRAGRDGSKAECILLYDAKDVITNQFIISRSEGNPNLSYEEQELVKERDLERLKIMTFYATTKDCLRHFILNYFGEWSQPRCGNCSNCLREYRIEDITQQGKLILKCIEATHQRFGSTLIAEVLKGSNNERIRRFGFDRLEMYGSMPEKSMKKIREIINTVVAAGYIQIEGSDYPILKINRAEAGKLFAGQEKITMKVFDDEVEKRYGKKGAGDKAGKAEYGNGKSGNGKSGNGKSGELDTWAGLSKVDISRQLYDKLKEYRLKKAREKSVPAYVIFTDKALLDMCMKLPHSKTELLDVHGVGEAKCNQYGDDILEIIRKNG